MTKLESLLKQVSEIVAKEKTQQEEKRKRGENFNIFNVLGLSTSEVRLHSAFLAELLNPNGDHGLGDKFLQVFINDIVHKNKESFAFDPQSAKVYVEYDIGTISEDYSEGGRIDLLIQDKNNQTIIIENKIDAGDQYKQLLRYNNYAKKKYNAEQYILLYLTKYGTSPTDESTGKQIFNYSCIGYEEDILNWLENCVGIAALFPRVRETITQYISNLKEITNIMSEDNKKELIELLKKNMPAALSILEIEEEIKKEVRRNFIETIIKRIAEKNGFNISRDRDQFIQAKYGSDLLFESEEEHKGAFVLSMYKTADVYYGVMLFDEQYKGVKGENVWKVENNMFPFGHGWIADTQSNCYWNRVSTIISMQKEIEMDEAENKEGTIAKEIDDALKVVKEKNLLDQLDKLCEDKS